MLTINEQARLAYANGRPSQALEAAADAELLADSLSGVDNLLHDAKCSYPNEGFCDDITLRLESLAKHMRGDNRKELLSIIEALDTLQLSVVLDSDEGRDNIKRAQQSIEGARGQYVR